MVYYHHPELPIPAKICASVTLVLFCIEWNFSSSPHLRSKRKKQQKSKTCKNVCMLWKTFCLQFVGHILSMAFNFPFSAKYTPLFTLSLLLCLCEVSRSEWSFQFSKHMAFVKFWIETQIQQSDKISKLAFKSISVEIDNVRQNHDFFQMKSDDSSTRKSG